MVDSDPALKDLVEERRVQIAQILQYPVVTLAFTIRKIMNEGSAEIEVLKKLCEDAKKYLNRAQEALSNPDNLRFFIVIEEVINGLGEVQQFARKIEQRFKKLK